MATLQELLRQGIIDTARAVGANPVDLATAISYETGGTFDPTKRGPTTKYGQHRGLIQFGEPQAKQYGVDWNNPIASQLGSTGAVAKYLQASGFKPGMGMMDLYSTINAGSPGRYNASDTTAGGAPGTVSDKVNQQMQAHRANAEALMGGLKQSDYAPASISGIGSPNAPGQNQPSTGAMFGTMAPGEGLTLDPDASLVAAAQQQPTFGQRLQYAGKYLEDALKPPKPVAPPMPQGNPNADAVLSILQNPQALAQMLLKQRMS